MIILFVLLLSTSSQTNGRDCDNETGKILCIESSFCNATYFSVNFSFNITENRDVISNISVRIKDEPETLSVNNPDLTIKNFSNFSVEDNINGTGHGVKNKQIQLYFKNANALFPYILSQAIVLFNCTNHVEVSTPTFATKTKKIVQTTFPQSTTAEPGFSHTAIFIVIFSIVLFLSLVFLLLCFKKLKKKRKTFIENIVLKQNEQASQNLPEKNNNENIEPKHPIQVKPTKLFLLFANDNEKHKQVVLNFANFLQADLGFDVTCELFQSLTISEDPVSWMDHNIKNADKIIVIWSPKAICLWSSRFNENDCKHDHYDLFTPVLKHIWNDIFNEKNIGKYYFSYFDYFNKNSIPKEFGDSQIYNFHLMQEFDELCCQLNEIEKYVPGGEMISEKVNFKTYFDKEINKYGAALQTSIATMVEFVKENRNWQQETEKIESDKIVEELDVDPLLMNVINISPPSPLKSRKNYVNIKTNEQISDDKDQSNLDFCFESDDSNYIPLDNVESTTVLRKDNLKTQYSVELNVSQLNSNGMENRIPTEQTQKSENDLTKNQLENKSQTLSHEIHISCTPFPAQISSNVNLHLYDQEDSASKRISNSCKIDCRQILPTQEILSLPSSTSFREKEIVNSIMENNVSTSVAPVRSQKYFIETEIQSANFDKNSKFVNGSTVLSSRNQNRLFDFIPNTNAIKASCDFKSFNDQNWQGNVYSEQTSHSEKVILAPLEVDSDPMKSLMALNMFNEHT